MKSVDWWTKNFHFVQQQQANWEDTDAANTGLQTLLWKCSPGQDLLFQIVQSCDELNCTV